MNHVIGVVGDPDFCFPCDLPEVLQQTSTIKKSGNEYESALAACEKGFQFSQSFRIYWTVAGDGFD